MKTYHNQMMHCKDAIAEHLKNAKLTPREYVEALITVETLLFNEDDVLRVLQEVYKEVTNLLFDTTVIQDYEDTQSAIAFFTQSQKEILEISTYYMTRRVSNPMKNSTTILPGYGTIKTSFTPVK